MGCSPSISGMRWAAGCPFPPPRCPPRRSSCPRNSIRRRWARPTPPRGGRLDQPRPGPRAVQGHARRLLHGHVFLVSIHRPTGVPAIRLERSGKSAAAILRRKDPRRLVPQPRLHAAAEQRWAGRIRSGSHPHASGGSRGRLRADRHVSGRDPRSARRSSQSKSPAKIDSALGASLHRIGRETQYLIPYSGYTSLRSR